MHVPRRPKTPRITWSHAESDPNPGAAFSRKACLMNDAAFTIWLDRTVFEFDPALEVEVLEAAGSAEATVVMAATATAVMVDTATATTDMDQVLQAV
jgi:hypothetical protein